MHELKGSQKTQKAQGEGPVTSLETPARKQHCCPPDEEHVSLQLLAGDIGPWSQAAVTVPMVQVPLLALPTRVSPEAGFPAWGRGVP